MRDNDLQGRNAFLEEVEALLKQGDEETALTRAESRLKQMPDDTDARIAICRILIKQGRLDEAKDLLQKIEGAIAGLSRIYASMGDVCLKEGMPESAQTFYQKFISLNPDSPMSRAISEKIEAIEAPQGADAEKEEEDSLRAPSDFQTVTLAELYIRQGHLRQAAEVLEAIISKDPQQEKAAAMLREVWDMIYREESGKKNTEVIAELSRWLDNIGRLRSHAI